jgi:hypothetical protein
MKMLSTQPDWNLIFDDFPFLPSKSCRTSSMTAQREDDDKPASASQHIRAARHLQ